MKSKYCFDYCEGVENLIDSTLAQIADDVRNGPAANDIAFLVLGGGYGRGEGGINFDNPSSPSLYNDLDFFVIAKTEESKKGLNSFFGGMSKKWTKIMGIDVDFGPAQTCRYISDRLDMMMWREMVMAGNVVVGDKNMFDKIFKIKTREMPPSETAKLLLNRTYGLFLAGRKLCEPPRGAEDFDFIARNINKSLLAAAESVLMSRGVFEFRTSDRFRALKEFDFKGDIPKDKFVAAYEAAAEFKRSPTRITDMPALWTKYECARDIVNISLAAVKGYIHSPEPFIKVLKNIKKNISLRKYFAKIGVKFNPAEDPVLPALNVFAANLESPCSLAEEKFSALKNIWKNIN